MSDISRLSQQALLAGDSLFIRAMPALFVLLWSTGFLVSKFGVQYAPSLTFLEWRYALALALLVPIVWLGRAP